MVLFFITYNLYTMKRTTYRILTILALILAAHTLATAQPGATPGVNMKLINIIKGPNYANAIVNIKLTSKPANNLPIKLSSNSPEVKSIAPNMITFHTGNWNIVQSVAIALYTPFDSASTAAEKVKAQTQMLSVNYSPMDTITIIATLCNYSGGGYNKGDIYQCTVGTPSSPASNMNTDNTPHPNTTIHSNINVKPNTDINKRLGKIKITKPDSLKKERFINVNKQ